MPELAKKIEGLPWIEDGIEGVREFVAIRGLILLADAGYTTRLIEEPWVVEGRNYAALYELHSLSRDPETLDRIMSHPAISDGITDQEAKVLATLNTAAYPVEEYLEDHDLLYKLLDPEQVTIEERTIALPLAGETELTIIRTHAVPSGAMDFVERSVRSVEAFMGLPFPRRQVIYLFVKAPGGGKHFDSHVQIRDSTVGTIAHETAHYYWRKYPTWLSEGAARFMEAVIADELHLPTDDILKGLLESKHSPCTLAQTIAEFEALIPPVPKSFQYYDCEYLLGTLLLHDLYHSMDDTTFRLAFRRLYLHTEFDASDDVCDQYGTSICHVKEAFTAYIPEEATPAVEDVFTRRYGRTDLPDASIRGVVTRPDGRSPGSMTLTFNRGRQDLFEVDVAPDGAFDVVVQSGSYIVVVRVLVGSELVFVGWYDGKGGITTDPSQAFHLIVVGDDVEGIDIMLPTDTESLLCPPGSHRSFRSGSCIPE